MATRKPGKGQVLRKMANPTPATLLVFNSHKGAKPMATRRKSKRRKAANPRRYASRAPVAARRPVTRTANPRQRKARAKNPLIIYRSKRKNPAQGEILEFVAAGTGIGFVQPWLASMASRFGIPGQWVTPVSTAGSGVGLYYLFGMFRQTKRFAHPALVLGISTAVVAVLAPIVRRWITPSASASMPANGPQGIGIWSGQPLRPPVALPKPAPKAVAAAAGPQGIGVWSRPAGRFARR